MLCLAKAIRNYLPGASFMQSMYKSAGWLAVIAVVFSLHAVELSGWGELGFLGVIDHKIQFGKSGTYFDYDESGGQDVLFPFARLSVDMRFAKNHTLIFLYQPLLIETEALLDQTAIIDSVSFPAGTPTRFIYSFPFYRLSYLYRLNVPEKWDLEIGLSLQIRNAVISFASLDGELFRTNRDVGPVPALKLRAGRQLTPRWRLGIEADGIYAPVSYLNGSDEDVTGAILDAAVRTAYRVRDPFDAFLSVRYLGGGAEGSSDDEGPGDGYVKNWLHFFIVSLGFHYSFGES